MYLYVSIRISWGVIQKESRPQNWSTKWNYLCYSIGTKLQVSMHSVKKMRERVLSKNVRYLLLQIYWRGISNVVNTFHNDVFFEALFLNPLIVSTLLTQEHFFVSDGGGSCLRPGLRLRHPHLQGRACRPGIINDTIFIKCLIHMKYIKTRCLVSMLLWKYSSPWI